MAALEAQDYTLCDTLLPYAGSVRLLSLLDKKTGGVFSDACGETHSHGGKETLRMLTSMVLEGRVVKPPSMYSHDRHAMRHGAKPHATTHRSIAPGTRQSPRPFRQTPIVVPVVIVLDEQAQAFGQPLAVRGDEPLLRVETLELFALGVIERLCKILRRRAPPFQHSSQTDTRAEAARHWA